MRSCPVGRLATTTGARHHRPRRMGRRSTATSAELGIDVQTDRHQRRRHRRHVGRRVRQRHAAAPTPSALVAAFDHRDVFLDPDPDPDRLVRRAGPHSPPARLLVAGLRPQRCSAGGGVLRPRAKAIELTRQVRTPCGRPRALTPAELIQAILQAPVDLLYLGGIGTFVRSSPRTMLGVDDRANARSGSRPRPSEHVSWGGRQPAFTQRARVEYARRGGRINVDAIDNSAGVDTSDREVNLKVLARLGLTRVRSPARRPTTGPRGAGRRRGRRAGRHPAPVRATLDRPGRERRATGLVRARPLASRRTVRSIRWSSPCPTPPISTLVVPPARGLPDPSWRWLWPGSSVGWRASCWRSAPRRPRDATGPDRLLPGRDGGRFGHLLPEHPLRRELSPGRSPTTSSTTWG